MNTELMEALNSPGRGKEHQQGHDAGCNRKFTDQCM